MRQPGTLRGALGQLKDGYVTAVVLAAWVIRWDEDRQVWTLHATVTTADPYRVTRPGLRFVAPHKSGAWKWPVTALTVGRDTLTADLGPLEE